MSWLNRHRSKETTDDGPNVGSGNASNGSAAGSGLGAGSGAPGRSGTVGNSGPSGRSRTADAGMSSTSEISEFAPRQDGDYHCASRGLYLRFARPAVTESDGSGAAPGHGEFTPSGRFTVQRRFGRPIVYTALGEDYGTVLVVRRTDTGTRESERLEFVFEPDGS